MKRWYGLYVSGLCLSVIVGTAWAEGDGDSSATKDEMKQKNKEAREAFREEQKDEWQAFEDSQEAKREEFKKSLEGLSGNAKVDAVVAHKKEMFTARMDFVKSRHDEKIAAIQASDMPEEKQAEKLEKMNQRYEEKVAHMTERYNEMLAKLESVKGDGSLSDEQKDEALKKLKEESKENRKAWREKQKEGKNSGDSGSAEKSE